MFEKVKNGSGRPNNQPLILGLCIAALTVGGLIGFYIKPVNMPAMARVEPVTEAAGIGNETVIIPLNSSAPIQTIQQYSGVVTMLVTGTGQVSGANYNDAFYTYMTAEQQLLTSPTMQYDFTLEIDGQSAYNLLHLNSDILPYSPTHTYVIQYDVGATPRPIGLRTSDGAVGDNTGELTVTLLGSDISLQKPVLSLNDASTTETFQASEGGEPVIVPFTSGSPVYTQGLYTGEVMLLIRGTGQAGGADYSDAFYLYAHGDHTPYVPPVLGDFDMELDGQPIHKIAGIAQNLPAYASDHVYRITYDVGAEPRQIGFRNTDGATGDNQGSYFVEVIPGT